MTANYLILSFTGLYLAGTAFYYRYAMTKGLVFRYKPMALLITGALFLLALYGIIFHKPYNEIVPFIG